MEAGTRVVSSYPGSPTPEIASAMLRRQQAGAIIAVLTERHDGEEDVTLLSQDSVLSAFGRILTALTLALGGIAAISEVTRLDLDPRHGGEGAWIVFHRGGNPLTIPVDAAGADALFDVFAALPGIGTGDLLAKLNAAPAHQIVIWEREPKRLH